MDSNDPFHWLPRFSNLTPSDSLWGVWKNRGNRSDELVAPIMQIGTIIKENQGKIERAKRSKCIEVGGVVFEHLQWPDAIYNHYARPII